MTSRFVENHTSTCGNTVRTLRRTPATTGRGSWYSCTHWQNTPSSARCERTIRKNSGVYSVATPATQGLDGSDTITSNRSRCSWRALRASSTTDETLAHPRIESLTLEKRGLIASTAGFISTTRTCRLAGTLAITPGVAPLPDPLPTAEVGSGAARPA